MSNPWPGRWDRATALVIVDLQRDFCGGGALAVPGGDDIVAGVNRLLQRCQHTSLPVIATRDWHPADHPSFVDNGGTWPSHCVAGTSGAEFHPDLQLPASARIVSKGQGAGDGYSAFENPELEAMLREAGVERVLVTGLATDYCVRATVLGALAAGFETFVLTDLIRGVNLEPEDCQRALEDMMAAGAQVVRSDGAATQGGPGSEGAQTE